MKCLLLAVALLSPLAANAAGYKATCENGYSFTLHWLNTANGYEPPTQEVSETTYANVQIKENGKAIALGKAPSSTGFTNQGRTLSTTAIEQDDYTYAISTETMEIVLIKMDRDGKQLFSKCKMTGGEQ